MNDTTTTQLIATPEAAEDEGREIKCDRCDAVEYVFDVEVNEETLEGAGWLLNPCSTLCPDCNEEDGDDED